MWVLAGKIGAFVSDDENLDSSLASFSGLSWAHQAAASSSSSGSELSWFEADLLSTVSDFSASVLLNWHVFADDASVACALSESSWEEWSWLRSALDSVGLDLATVTDVGSSSGHFTLFARSRAWTESAPLAPGSNNWAVSLGFERSIETVAHFSAKWLDALSVSRDRNVADSAGWELLFSPLWALWELAGDLFGSDVKSAALWTGWVLVPGGDGLQTSASVGALAAVARRKTFSFLGE